MTFLNCTIQLLKRRSGNVLGNGHIEIVMSYKTLASYQFSNGKYVFNLPHARTMSQRRQKWSFLMLKNNRLSFK